MTRFAIVLAALLLAGCGAAAQEPSEPSADLAPAVATSSTAVVVCGDEGASVETPEVAASRDGVHVELRNETGAEQAIHVEAGESGQGEGIPPGTHARVWALPPGAVAVTCSDSATGPAEQAGATFEVVDPDGLWVSTELDCAEVTGAVLDYIVDAPGVQGDPVDVARASAEVDVARDDVVELAGYPNAADGATVRVVRDGRAIALVGLAPAQDGGWLVTTVSRCADA